jgi:hypothetical protein
MPQEIFRASVQYNDWIGTSAADNHDNQSLHSYLKERREIGDDETLVGVEMWSGEVHERTQDRPIHVTALIASVAGHDDLQTALQAGASLHVRRVQFEMPLNVFFGYFKRFEVHIALGGLIDGHSINYD